MSDKHLPGLALLELLRPPPGWRVDRALLSSYSAEPAAVAAALLALAGRDDEAGSASKPALARALLELRGRVTIVLQRGRFAASQRGGIILKILDRYVREVAWNEGRDDESEGRSWHPKCAIVRLVSETEEDAMWRFHLGSRNLTRDLSWDMGLRLDGSVNESVGQKVSGIARVAARLATVASEPDAWAPLVVELRRVRWNVPRGLVIRRIDLLLPGDGGRGLPKEPGEVSEIVAVSPFLDGGAVSQISKWGTDKTQRTLLSTRPALAQLARQVEEPLAPFNHLLALPEISESQETKDQQEQTSTEAEVEEQGLHAKFLWAEHGAGTTLWLGSANLTKRGWKRNGELVAEVEVERRGNALAARELREGIRAFVDRAESVRIEELGGDECEPSDLDRLEEARRQVAARLDARQVKAPDDRTWVECASPPHPDNTTIELSIGPVGGAMTEWPRGEGRITLIGASTETPTELLTITLSLNDEEVSWTQRAPFDPLLDSARLDQRDAAALSAWLGARGMLSAVRDLLDGTPEGEVSDSEKWNAPDADGKDKNTGIRGGLYPEVPTLEQALKAWIREPRRLALVEQLLTAEIQPLANADDDGSQAQLDAFRRMWATLRASLTEQPLAPLA